jgi:hypothetical protein
MIDHHRWLSRSPPWDSFRTSLHHPFVESNLSKWLQSSVMGIKTSCFRMNICPHFILLFFQLKSYVAVHADVDISRHSVIKVMPPSMHHHQQIEPPLWAQDENTYPSHFNNHNLAATFLFFQLYCYTFIHANHDILASSQNQKMLSSMPHH